MQIVPAYGMMTNNDRWCMGEMRVLDTLSRLTVGFTIVIKMKVAKIC